MNENERCEARYPITVGKGDLEQAIMAAVLEHFATSFEGEQRFVAEYEASQIAHATVSRLIPATSADSH